MYPDRDSKILEEIYCSHKESIKKTNLKFLVPFEIFW